VSWSKWNIWENIHAIAGSCYQPYKHIYLDMYWHLYLYLYTIRSFYRYCKQTAFGHQQSIDKLKLALASFLTTPKTADNTPYRPKHTPSQKPSSPHIIITPPTIDQFDLLRGSLGDPWRILLGGLGRCSGIPGASEREFHMVACKLDALSENNMNFLSYATTFFKMYLLCLGRRVHNKITQISWLWNMTI